MTAPKIYQALLDAAQEIGAIKKSDVNRAAGGGYNFRGVDRVVNATSPAFHKHQILVFPEVLEHSYRQQQVGSKQTVMQSVTVRVRYSFVHAGDGSTVEAVVVGEAGDSGDKATPKAMSVALRTALLQTLMLPTDEPDPDSFTYGHDEASGVPESRPEPVGPPAPSPELVEAILALAPVPVDAPKGARVVWAKEQAAAHGYDMMNGPQMGVLLDELRAEAALAAAGATPDVDKQMPESGR